MKREQVKKGDKKPATRPDQLDLRTPSGKKLPF